MTTTSGAGLRGSIAQSNYVAAKAGIAAFTINAAAELGRYGVARQHHRTVGPQPDDRGGDARDDGATGNGVRRDGSRPTCRRSSCGSGARDCDVTGRAFEMAGGDVCVMNGWNRGPAVDEGRRLTPAEVGPVLRRLVAAAPVPEAVHGT